MPAFSQAEAFVAEEGMSRAEELELLEDCFVNEVALKTDSYEVQNLALLVARFVHLVREKESREDEDAWDALVGP